MGFKSALKSILPAIGAALPLPPPFGQMAASAIGKAIGVDGVTIDNAEKVISEAQAKDPEILLKLKQADQEFELALQKLGVESAAKLAEIDASDRASARGREMAVRDRTPMVLAYLVVALVIFGEGYMLVHGVGTVEPNSAVIVGRILGTLDTALVMVLAYYFGSSAGSARKTELASGNGK